MARIAFGVRARPAAARRGQFSSRVQAGPLFVPTVAIDTLALATS